MPVRHPNQTVELIRARCAHRTARGLYVALALACAMLLPAAAFAQEEKPADGAAEKPVSFYRQIRPVLQRNCAGCHQPSKLGGQLLLTTHAGLLKGGENGPAVVTGKPDESLMIDFISGEKPEMPRNADPLSPQQIQLISRWIAEGAKDDSPTNVEDSVTQANPPKYAAAPVVTALAYSPDSQLLAVSGYHEVLLHRADGSGLAARLVGRSQKINSLSFSSDGTLLGVTGGAPALFGEVQIWNVADRTLKHSISVSFDTLFGGSFSDDGTKFAFGGADNRARVIKVDDGKEIMRFDAHADWVLGTTFSQKLDHLITVSRDRSMKLVIIESAQFVDNITSITPGALKGGLMAVERHPQKEQVLIGGADGEPKLYKIFRTRTRIIGDDFNHIRSYQAMPGRICDLEFNKAGDMFIAGSSTAIAGAARIYKTGEYPTEEINNGGGLEDTRRETAQRSQENNLVHELPGITGPVFAVAFRPDGQQVAVAGFDGKVQLFDVTTGKLAKEFIPVELTPEAVAGTASAAP